ncbi:hypothetical protein ACO2KH_18690 [Leptospira terpstrae]|uniref:hypothetical protein n=1 Tax=Leptospira terpstrae TaxID=293075 RepID=UPI003D04027C
MKPKFDIKDPRVKKAMEELAKIQQFALSADPKIEKAVIPIAYYKDPDKKLSRPELNGSGVLIKIKNLYFIFTATHVLLPLKHNAIITGVGNGDFIENLSGERYSTGNPDYPEDDQYDATVYHITSGMSNMLKEKALNLSDIELKEIPQTKSIYLVSGFPAKKSLSEKGKIESKKDLFASFEFSLEIYEKLNYNPKSHIILTYEDLVLTKEQWLTSPRPQGVSGGAIIRINGLSIFPTNIETKTPVQKLSSIMTQHHREKNRNPGYILGTRINVFLGLLKKYFPKLVDDFL